MGLNKVLTGMMLIDNPEKSVGEYPRFPTPILNSNTQKLMGR